MNFVEKAIFEKARKTAKIAGFPGQIYLDRESSEVLKI